MVYSFHVYAHIINAEKNTIYNKNESAGGAQKQNDTNLDADRKGVQSVGYICFRPILRGYERAVSTGPEQVLNKRTMDDMPFQRSELD